MLEQTDLHNTAVRVNSVRKEFNAQEQITAVDDVTFDISTGSVVGILGPNGAGKTTLIKSILGVVIPDSGTVELFGNETSTLGRERYRYVSSMLEGARNIYWRMSVRENIRYFTGLMGVHPDSVQTENAELVSRLGISEKLDEPVRNLSRGQKQRASLACVLAQHAPITFLDEPTLGLDVRASEVLREEIKK